MRKWPCRAAPSRWVQRTLHQIVQCQEWNDQAYTKNSDIWWDMSITTDHSRITFVLPYICLPRCIRIGVVESIHVPTLGRQFSCGIQTITQGAPEITCITRWRTDQYIHNRSKGDIKWDKTAGCINFLCNFWTWFLLHHLSSCCHAPSVEMQTWMVSQAAGEASTVTCQCQLVSHMAASLDQIEINGTYEVNSKHPASLQSIDNLNTKMHGPKAVAVLCQTINQRHQKIAEKIACKPWSVASSSAGPTLVLVSFGSSRPHESLSHRTCDQMYSTRSGTVG